MTISSTMESSECIGASGAISLMAKVATTPDHEGKNIGLAARLAGHTGSYSDAIKRGSSFGNRAKAAAKSFGRRHNFKERFQNAKTSA